MKILIICHEFPPIGGGAANAAFYIASCLRSKHHEVTVITSRFKRVSHANYDFNIAYLSVLRKHIDRTSPLELISFALSGIIYSLFNIRKSRYDVCLAVHGIPSGWAAFFIRKIFGIPYIVSLRGGDVPGFLPMHYNKLHQKVKFLTNLYWRNADSIITNSEGLRELADKTAKLIGVKTKVIPNGVDCNIFRPDYSLRDNNSIRIVYAGRITPQKGLEDFIQSIINITGKIKNTFKIKIIGEGHLKTSLEYVASNLRKKGVIEFAGWMNKGDLVEEYKRSHIFILPSFYEGMSNSLLEAMACGCMVIARDIPVNRQLVNDAKNGFLFTSNNIEQVLINSLNASIGTIEKMGAESRIIAELYNWESVTDAYLDECNNIIMRDRKVRCRI